MPQRPARHAASALLLIALAWPALAQPAGMDEAKKLAINPSEGAGRWAANKSLAGRSAPHRAKLAADNGGSDESEAAVELGLAWLRKAQDKDGGWTFDGKNAEPIKTRPAAAGLALMAFLGAGETHKGAYSPDGQQFRATPHTKAVAAGVKFLTALLGNGSTFGTPKAYAHYTYMHAIATLALCEAYGMTSDPNLKPFAQRAVTTIAAGQLADGGWGYQYGSSRADTSIHGWQVQALKSGASAGLAVKKEVLEKAMKYLDGPSGPFEKVPNAVYGYVSGGANVAGTPTLTAIGLLARTALGWDPSSHPSFQAGCKYLARSAKADTRNAYGEYYVTQVMRLAGGKPWDDYNGALRDALVKSQVTAEQDKKEAGSWERKADTSFVGDHCDRLGVTCFNVLILEVYYRHLPPPAKPGKAKD